jgi:hypothetical protein
MSDQWHSVEYAEERGKTPCTGGRVAFVSDSTMIDGTTRNGSACDLADQC